MVGAIWIVEGDGRGRLVWVFELMQTGLQPRNSVLQNLGSGSPRSVRVFAIFILGAFPAWPTDRLNSIAFLEADESVTTEGRVFELKKLTIFNNLCGHK